MASRHYAIWLSVLALLFISRVTGQALVAFAGVARLPPFERWQSGLLPYPLLLAAQIVIIAVQLAVVRDFARGAGFFVNLSPRTGKILIGLGALYALGMIVRYVLTMIWHPELRWFTGTIPIWFHLVLAAFIYLVGRYSVRRAQKS